MLSRTFRRLESVRSAGKEFLTFTDEIFPCPDVSTDNPLLSNDAFLDQEISGFDDLLAMCGNELPELGNLERYLNYEELEPVPVQNVQQVPEALPALEPEQDQNLLIINVPNPMQTSEVFNKFPTVSVSTEVLSKLNETTGQTHGVFMPLTALQAHQSATATLKAPIRIVRRPPLQIIQHINIAFPENVQQEPVKPLHVGKRKQQFKFKREDGAEFVADLEEVQESSPEKRPKIAEPEVPAPPPPVEVIDLDVWESTDGNEDTDVASEVGEVVKELCVGCKKSFKKLSTHKCKKDPLVSSTLLNCSFCKKVRGFNTEEELSDHLKVSHPNSMVCGFCGKGFKSKPGLVRHHKVCAPVNSEVKVAKPKPVKKLTKPRREGVKMVCLRSAQNKKNVKSFK